MKIDRALRGALFSVSKNIFGTLADCKKVRKPSNLRLSAYRGTVGRELRWKQNPCEASLSPRMSGERIYVDVEIRFPAMSS